LAATQRPLVNLGVDEECFLSPLRAVPSVARSDSRQWSVIDELLAPSIVDSWGSGLCVDIQPVVRQCGFEGCVIDFEQFSLVATVRADRIFYEYTLMMDRERSLCAAAFLRILCSHGILVGGKDSVNGVTG
jgi:hypothetical protein